MDKDRISNKPGPLSKKHGSRILAEFVEQVKNRVYTTEDIIEIYAREPDYEQMVLDCKINKCTVSLYTCNAYTRLRSMILNKYPNMEEMDINLHISKNAYRKYKNFYEYKLKQRREISRRRAIQRVWDIRRMLHVETTDSDSESSDDNSVDTVILSCPANDSKSATYSQFNNPSSDQMFATSTQTIVKKPPDSEDLISFE